MSTLCLNLRKEWFEKIESGEKTTEYREFKPFWTSRLNKTWMNFQGQDVSDVVGKIYTDVCFSLGYSYKRVLRFEIADVSLVCGKDTDLAIDRQVYAIKLGRRL